LALGGCGERHHAEHKIWTLFDALAAARAHTNVAMGPTLPQGLPAAAMVSDKGDGTYTLTVNTGFAEGKPAAFVTTELWVNFDEDAWVQPIYAQYDKLGSPLPDAPLLIDVGPASAFYSPFWGVKVATVEHAYKSTRDLLDDHVPITETGLVKTC